MEENEIKKCIVKIKKNDLHGTGFFIDTNKILTCFHVIKDVEIDEVKVVFNGKDYSVELVDKKEEFEIDLAILKVELSNKNFLKIDNTISDEDKLRSYGFANSEDYFDNAPEGFERGCVPVTLEYEGNDDHFMKFKNAQVEGGHSGSPIINLSTKSVCGVLNISRNPDNNLGGYGIPIKKLKLLKYKEQNKNEIIEKILLNNGEFVEIEFVKVELEDKTIYVGKYPVIIKEYNIFCTNQNILLPKGNKINENKPIVNISFTDAKAYCNWLNQNSKNVYKLLNSMDWEIIAKMNIPKKNFNKYIISSKKKRTKIKKKGLLGLYDFVGNTYEWCDNNYIRGISFSDEVSLYNDLFNEIMVQPSTRKDNISFRVVRYEYNSNKI